MATDYDAPRKTEEDLSEDSIEELKDPPDGISSPPSWMRTRSRRRKDTNSRALDLSGEELLVRVLPAQADEFTCSSCFLARYRSQIAREKDGLYYCKDCEG